MTVTNKEKIGILGGSFDPIHCGHLAVAQLLHDHLNLDKTLLIPAGTPPHKKYTVNASAQHRAEMLTLAITENKDLTYWDGELRREGSSFTVDTLRILHENFTNSEFFYIIGSDNIHEIPKWKSYKDILKLATLAIVDRPGYSIDIPEEIKKYNPILFPSPHWGISSSDIREKLHNGYSCKYMLPDTVIHYIKKHNLYQNFTP